MDPVLPDQPDLEFERKRAKALLKAARAGDPEALARVPSSATLAGAQRAVARERGFGSWADLKAHIESLRPLEEHVRPLLDATLDRKPGVIQRLLSRHPGLARHDIHTASAAGDPVAVADFLARDPASATASHPETGIPPIIYASATPVHRLGAGPATDVVRCVQLLLDAGADPNTSVPSGEQDAPVPALYYACVEDDVPVARLLLERGAAVDDGESLHHAAENGHLEVLELLVEHGVDLDALGSGWGKTVLYFLAQVDGDPAGVAWLLERGADPDLPSGESGETPLHRVADTGNLALAELLVRHGATIDAVRADGRTPYRVAVRAGNDAVARLLADAGARTDGVGPRDQVLAACWRGDARRARDIAERNGLTGPVPAEDSRMLIHAARRDRVEAIRAMAAAGFDIAAIDPEDGTALHTAAWWGRPAAVRTLIELGAPLDVLDPRFGGTPLGWAAHGSRNCRSADRDYLAVVDALADAGADGGSSESWRESPASAASRAVRSRLIERGY